MPARSGIVIDRRQFLRSSAGALLAAPTFAPAVRAQNTAVNPGTVTAMVGNLGAERFDSVLDTSGTLSYGSLMHAFLVEVDSEGKLVPGVATDWELSSDSRTWTLTIRKGVRFHDETEVTAEDVLWSLQHTFGPGADEYNKVGITRQYIPLITALELRGPDRVAVTFTEPHLEFPYVLSPYSSGWVPVMPRRAAQHDPEIEMAYDRNPIGAGPMRLVEHIHGEGMKFERFDGFYKQPQFGFSDDQSVRFQRLDLYAVPEEATRIAALRAGDADVAPIGIAARDQVTAAGGRLIFSRYGVNIEPRMYGCWNADVPGHDKRVRHALDLAIDKQQIQQFYGGPEIFEIRGWYRLTPVSEGYTPETDPRPFDPERARQLLAEAGYPGGAGFGPLILNTFPSLAIPFQVETAQIVAATWRKELGLDVEVKTWEAAAYRQEERKGTPLWGQMAWQDNNPQYDISVTVQGKYAGTTIERFAEDPELIALIKQTYSEIDPAKRLTAIQQLYVRLREESYNIGVGLINIPWAVGPRIESWQPLPLSSYLSAAHTLTLHA